MPVPIINDVTTGAEASEAINRGFTRGSVLSGNYELVEADDGKVFLCTASLTVTLPNGLTDNFSASFRVVGDYVVTFSADGTLTSQFAFIGSYEQATVVHLTGNAWYGTGDL